MARQEALAGAANRLPLPLSQPHDACALGPRENLVPTYLRGVSGRLRLLRVFPVELVRGRPLRLAPLRVWRRRAIRQHDREERAAKRGIAAKEVLLSRRRDMRHHVAASVDLRIVSGRFMKHHHAAIGIDDEVIASRVVLQDRLAGSHVRRHIDSVVQDVRDVAGFGVTFGIVNDDLIADVRANHKGNALLRRALRAHRYPARYFGLSVIVQVGQELDLNRVIVRVVTVD